MALFGGNTELELVEYSNSSEAIREVTGYIRYYNAERRLVIGYAAPIQYEAQQSVLK